MLMKRDLRGVDLIMMQQLGGSAGVLACDDVDGFEYLQRSAGKIGEVSYWCGYEIQSSQSVCD